MQYPGVNRYLSMQGSTGEQLRKVQFRLQQDGVTASVQHSLQVRLQRLVAGDWSQVVPLFIYGDVVASQQCQKMARKYSRQEQQSMQQECRLALMKILEGYDTYRIGFSNMLCVAYIRCITKHVLLLRDHRDAATGAYRHHDAPYSLERVLDAWDEIQGTTGRSDASLPEALKQYPAYDETLYAQERLQQLLDAINDLPALAMQYWHLWLLPDMNKHKIMQALGVTMHAVNTVRRESLQTLRDKLLPQYGLN